MNQESVTTSQHLDIQDSPVQKIMALWMELVEVRNAYSECGANESEADWKIQGTLYAISFCVPADVPKTPKRYGLLNKDGNAARAFECASELHRILSLIQVEFRAFSSGLLPDELYEWLLVSCWRFCQRP